jgi:hypothetical protein
MTTPQDVQLFIGRTAVDSEGNKVGKIGQVYLDERSGLPLWVTVATGMLGTRQSFAPIDGSGFDGDQVRLAVSKDLVSHEEVHVEREPITDANRDAALSGEPISEEEHEVALRAERPVAAKEAVPVERVRLATETVTEDAAVSETVRKEQIEEPEVDVNPRDAGR